jgi:hypothetical protein
MAMRSSLVRLFTVNCQERWGGTDYVARMTCSSEVLATVSGRVSSRKFSLCHAPLRPWTGEGEFPRTSFDGLESIEDDAMRGFVQQVTRDLLLEPGLKYFAGRPVRVTGWWPGDALGGGRTFACIRG